MTANVPLGFPEAIFDSQTISDAFARKAVTPQLVRDDAVIQEALANNQMSIEQLIFAWQQKQFLTSPPHRLH